MVLEILTILPRKLQSALKKMVTNYDFPEIDPNHLFIIRHMPSIIDGG